LQTAPSKAFAVWHPSLSYFARDYGLEQISVSFENKEMSPVRLAEVADEARAHNVGVFFFQQDYDSRQAQTLNNAMKTKMITVNPLAYDWDKELSNVVDALAQ
jgi:zinc transport system substrate-binding protein